MENHQASKKDQLAKLCKPTKFLLQINHSLENKKNFWEKPIYSETPHKKNNAKVTNIIDIANTLAETSTNVSKNANKQFLNFKDITKK